MRTHAAECAHRGRGDQLRRWRVSSRWRSRRRLLVGS